MALWSLQKALLRLVLMRRRDGEEVVDAGTYMGCRMKEAEDRGIKAREIRPLMMTRKKGGNLVHIRRQPRKPEKPQETDHANNGDAVPVHHQARAAGPGNVANNVSRPAT